MNITSIERCPPAYHDTSLLINQWVRVCDGLPTQGSIVPVWDGQHIYYASFWLGKLSGYLLWIVSDVVSPNMEHVDSMKGPGEQVHPIHWMKIGPPPKDR